MFTGLVEAVGTIAALSGPASAAAVSSDKPRRLRIATALAEATDSADATAAADGAHGPGLAPGAPGRPMRLGDSVAVDGCCLTVVARESGHLSFEAATETLMRTTLGRLQPGDRVHLERALRFGDRLGGHMVSGHVDAVGTLVQRQMRGSALFLRFEAPSSIAKLVAARGSITVSGVSLTVTDTDSDTFCVALIPHTLARTALGALRLGDGANLEADLIARYVARLLQQGAQSPADASGAEAAKEPRIRGFRP